MRGFHSLSSLASIPGASSLVWDQLTGLNVDVSPAHDVVEIVDPDNVKTGAFLGAVGWVRTDETKYPDRAIELLARGGICQHNTQNHLPATQIWRKWDSKYDPTTVGLKIKKLRGYPGATPANLACVRTCGSNCFGVD